MRIIQKTPNESGAYPPIQEVSLAAVPEGCALVPDELDTSVFYAYGGFVRLTVSEEDVVTAMEGDEEAYQAWEEAHPAWEEAHPEPEPREEPEYVTYADLAAAIREGVNAV